MQKLYDFLSDIMWIFIGLFVGVCIYDLYSYIVNPDFFLLEHGLKYFTSWFKATLLICLLLMTGMYFIKKKIIHNRKERPIKRAG